jgi:hypothetical protein
MLWLLLFYPEVVDVVAIAVLSRSSGCCGDVAVFYPEVVDVVAVAVATPGMLQTPHSSSSETGRMSSHLQPPFSHARIVVSQSWNSDSLIN